MSRLLLPVWIAACSPPPPIELRAEVQEGAVEVQASEPVGQIEVLDSQGRPVATRRLDPPLDRVSLPASWRPGESWTVRASSGTRSSEVPVQAPALQLPATVEVQAPMGQDAVLVSDGDAVEFALPVGGSATVGLLIRTQQRGIGAALEARLGDQTVQRDNLSPGEAVLLTADVRAPTDAEIQIGTTHWMVTVVPQLYEPGAPGAPDLQIVGGHFPTFPDGTPDSLRPRDRIDLPSPAWSRLLQQTGLGTRGRDPWAAWAWQTVEVHNPGSIAANAVIRVTVTDGDGRMAPAFRPRLREVDDGTGQVSVLLRVPPESNATALVPLFVDPAAVGREPRTWQRRIEATLLGAPTAAASASLPLHTGSGRPWVSGAFGALLTMAVAGWMLMARNLRTWLRGRTADLVTIALFGTLDFVVRTTANLLASGVAALLGPFAILVTGLLDDVLHISLLATLLTLLPRPGTATLSVVLGWLMRGLATGGFGPQDLVFLGSKVFLLEASLYLAGLTRDPAWRDASPGSRWLRLALGLAPAHALTTGLALVGHMVFFRLFIADWYVAMVVLLPGFAYVLLATGFATRLADSLRRVEP